MIDILIPTFNRCESLKKNLIDLGELMKKENLERDFRILVSNNASTDCTKDMLEVVSKDHCCKLIVYNHRENMGLERNAVFLLKESCSEFIMYLGDDDYLPRGYLTEIVNKIHSHPKLGVVIPGFTAVDADGNKRISRKARKNDIRLDPGFGAVLRFSSFGHQLSGLLLRREGLYEEYTLKENLRNIYPFVYFVAKNNVTFVSFYAPRFQVLISVSNSKDWRYDELGLLGEIIKNYQILYPNSVLRQTILSLVFIARQRWRLRISIRPKTYLLAANALKHFIKNPVPPRLLKISVIIFLPFLYMIEFATVVLRRARLR